MWNWFNCYVSGRHEFGVWCEPGSIFLRCMHCGRRSSGWTVGAQHAGSPTRVAPAALAKTVVALQSRLNRILPFVRAAAR
jgi:hypothetical protein